MSEIVSNKKNKKIPKIKTAIIISVGIAVFLLMVACYCKINRGLFKANAAESANVASSKYYELENSEFLQEEFVDDNLNLNDSLLKGSESVSGTKKIKNLMYWRGGTIIDYSSVDSITKSAKDVLSTFNNSPFDSFSLPLMNGCEAIPSGDKFKILEDIINNNSINSAGKKAMPMLRLARIMGCDNGSCMSSKKIIVMPSVACNNNWNTNKIKGIDIYDEQGAWTKFKKFYEAALNIAQKTNSGGITIDPESYSNYYSYDVNYIAERQGKSNAEVIKQLKSMGAELADKTNNAFPGDSNFVIWSLFISFHKKKGGENWTTDLIFEGMLERAKEKSYKFKLIEGGEVSLWYIHPSNAELKEKISNQKKMLQAYLNKYPNLKLGGVAGLYLNSETLMNGWKKAYNNWKNVQIKKIDDFEAPLKTLFNNYEYIWVYNGFSGMGYCSNGINYKNPTSIIENVINCENGYNKYYFYNDFDAASNRFFRPVIFKALGKTPPSTTCSDGTGDGKCSSSKPQRCDNGNLINKCSQCGCPQNQICQTDGSCKILKKTYNLQDFKNLVKDWLKTITDSPADVNLDNKVNTRDLGIIMNGWK